MPYCQEQSHYVSSSMILQLQDVETKCCIASITHNALYEMKVASMKSWASSSFSSSPTLTFNLSFGVYW